MGRRAEVGFGFGGIKEGIKDLGDLKDALAGVEGAGKRLDATYKGLKNLWEDPAKAKGGWSAAQRVQVGLIKMGAEIIGQQVTAATRAVTAPAMSSYDQILAKQRSYRDSTQRLATATGETFVSVDKRILDTSKRLGLLPGQVSAYGAAIRSQTGGTMEEALSGIDAAQARALKTGQSIEDLIGPMTALRQTFGLKSTMEVSKFFDTLDTQARGAGVSAEVAGHAFAATVGLLTRVISARPAALTGLTTQVLGNAQAAGLPVEMGVENIGEIGGFLARHKAFLERRAHALGLLKKGEHLTKGGQFTEEGALIGLEIGQKEMPGFYHAKGDPELAGLRAEQAGELSAVGYHAIMSVNTKKLRQQVNAKASNQAALDAWFKSEAGRGEAAYSSKERADLGFAGGKLLLAQDAAVGAGGGAAGLALAAAAANFDKATGLSANAVDLFVGKVASKGVAAAVGAGTAAVEGAVGGTATTVARTVLPKVVGAGVATGVGLATVATMPGDTVLPEEVELRDQLAMRQHQAKDMERGGRGKWTLASLVGLEQKDSPQKAAADIAALTARIAELEAAKRAQGAGQPGSSADYTAMGDAVGNALSKQLPKALGSTILKTQEIKPPTAPPGQPVER